MLDTTKVTIETERLRLVPIALGYLEEIFKEFTPEVTKYMFPQPTGDIKDIRKFISESLERMKKGENLQLVAINKVNREFLGCVGLHEIHKPDPEMGIWLKRSAQGSGYGKEAMLGVKKWAEGNLFYEHIKYPVAKANNPSRQVAEYLGGKVVKEYMGTNQNGDKMEEVEYWIERKSETS
ncbi:MAG TPA: GNAT family N-acetyltransferase [Patescibacteria group bacterium]|nr:GNAT family N-acetyltransferase [Patescibacteria group bacterium]